jgi:pantetheine-phosphate adenylyltransferase
VKTGIYPGTFDPITMGHLDVVKRSLKLVDRLIIAVTARSQKSTTFTAEERAAMIRHSLAELDLDLEVEVFDCLLMEYARRKKAQVIFRGLRAVSDFEYEFQMALMNKRLAPEIEVVFLTPDQSYIYLSSSLVKEVVSLGGNITDLVTPYVEKFLHQRFGLNAGGGSGR